MKIIIERASLLKILTHTQSIVERRNTIPILSNVLIKALDGQITVTATDLDLQATESINAEVIVPGSITVSAGILFDIVRKMPDGAEITMALQDRRMIVSAGRSRFTLPVLEAGDFPLIAQGELPNQLIITSEQLYGMLGATRFAMSKEVTRHYLNGIYLHTMDDALIAASTDGHRLARLTIKRPPECADMDGAILPSKCVTVLHKVLDHIDDCEINISFSQAMMRFDLGNIVFVSKLVDGTYPDYTRVVPTQNSRIVIADARALHEIIDRVTTITQEKTRAVKLALTQNKMTVSVSTPDYGVANEEMDVDYDSDDFEIGFNGTYLKDILAQQRDGMVKIAFGDSHAPALLVPQNDNDFYAVLMPIRI